MTQCQSYPYQLIPPHFAKMCLMWYACTATSAVQLLKMAGAVKRGGVEGGNTHFTLVRPRVKLILFSLIVSSQVLRDVGDLNLNGPHDIEFSTITQPLMPFLLLSQFFGRAGPGKLGSVVSPAVKNDVTRLTS